VRGAVMRGVVVGGVIRGVIRGMVVQEILKSMMDAMCSFAQGAGSRSGRDLPPQGWPSLVLSRVSAPSQMAQGDLLLNINLGRDPMGD